MSKEDKRTAEKVRNWWSTEIIDMRPGKIRIRGENIEDLIGKISFVQMIWLMIQGKMPEVEEACLMEAALVASVDHGPQAPAISTAGMAVSCGNSLNHALASAVNMLGDVHGGAGEQCLELMQKVKDLLDKGGKFRSLRCRRDFKTSSDPGEVHSGIWTPFPQTRRPPCSTIDGTGLKS